MSRTVQVTLYEGEEEVEVPIEVTVTKGWDDEGDFLVFEFDDTLAPGRDAEVEDAARQILVDDE